MCLLIDVTISAQHQLHDVDAQHRSEFEALSRQNYLDCNRGFISAISVPPVDCPVFAYDMLEIENRCGKVHVYLWVGIVNIRHRKRVLGRIQHYCSKAAVKSVKRENLTSFIFKEDELILTLLWIILLSLHHNYLSGILCKALVFMDLDQSVTNYVKTF